MSEDAEVFAGIAAIGGMKKMCYNYFIMQTN